MESIIIVSAIIIALLIEVYTWKAGVVPMPTIPRVRREMVSLLPTKISSDILELGSGWGGLLIDLAITYPNNTVIGYELSPLPYWVCRLRVFIGGYHNIILKRRDFMDISFENSGALLCYLTHQHMAILEPKLQQEMPRGSVLVTSTFPLPTKKIDQQVTSKGLWDVNVFSYQF